MDLFGSGIYRHVGMWCVYLILPHGLICMFHVSILWVGCLRASCLHTFLTCNHISVAIRAISPYWSCWPRTPYHLYELHLQTQTKDWKDDEDGMSHYSIRGILRCTLGQKEKGYLATAAIHDTRIQRQQKNPTSADVTGIERETIYSLKAEYAGTVVWTLLSKTQGVQRAIVKKSNDHVLYL